MGLLSVRVSGSVFPQQMIVNFSNLNSISGNKCLFIRGQRLNVQLLSKAQNLRGQRAIVRCDRKSSGEPSEEEEKPNFLSLDFLLQVGIFLFAAGFVDAGFSGDWSRIGVLTKETEYELQMAAVGVVPLAATLIWSINQRKKL